MRHTPTKARSLQLVLISASLLLGRPASAQSGTPSPMPPLRDPDSRVAPTLAAISQGKRPGGVAQSPDGTLLAWTVAGSIQLTELGNDGEKDRTVPSHPKQSSCVDSDPIWSPDGAQLAFMSSCDAASGSGSQEQLFVWGRRSGDVRQLTHVTGAIESPAWAPDSKQIGFLFVDNATRSAGALAAMKPWSGVVGEDGVEVQRVAVVHLKGGDITQVTPPNLHVFDWDWSPNARELTYVAAAPPGENNWWVAKLYLQTIGGAAMPRVLLDPGSIAGEMHGLQIANPRISPDGKRVAFIGGLMSDQGSTGGDIWETPIAGGAAPRDIMPDRSVSAAWFEFSGRTSIRYVARKGGGNLISTFNTETAKDFPGTAEFYAKSISAGAGHLVSASRSGAYAFAASSFDNPPEIFLSHGPRQPLRQITHLNDGLKPVWGKSESIQWENQGFHIQGWLLYPADYDPAKHYPLLVDVHGGPSASITSRWGGGEALFSALGYFTFTPNPRGSYGQGEAFTAANRKDFGYGDLRDILAGMDVLEKRFPIDTTREGLTGWSYGGFMTMFAVTQTHRFRAAVAGAGISDWQSYYGENSIDQWMVPFFGATVYDDPAVYAKSSAINFIKDVKTPTLVIVGDRDGECPAPQSFEFWHALRAQGVKTQLVIYPNEGHGFRDPAHITDRAQRTFQWFAQNMPAH